MKKANEEINNSLEQGKAMEAFEKYYAEEVTMQENETEPRVGKNLNREICFGEAAVKKFSDLKLTVLSTAYGDNISIQEVLFDYTSESGQKVHYPEVAVRHWKNGQVINEKFYYGGSRASEIS